MFNVFKRLFRKKKAEYEYKPYIERDTECDKCEFLEQCKNDGYVINCTFSGDDKEHYMRGLGSNCRK